MVRRLGIGASAASALIFSVLLVSNLAVFVASQNRAEFYSKSDASDLLADQATAMTGAAATNLLLEVQSIVSAVPLGCSNATGVVATSVEKLADVQRSSALVVNASIQESPGASGVGLPTLTPFNGSMEGGLNLSINVSARSEASLSGVSFSRDATYPAHLPVRLDSAKRDCLGAVAAISAAVSASQVSNCTSQTVSPVMESVSASQATAFRADGFGFGLDYSVASQHPCTVSFRVSLEQQDIPGPGGAFSLLLEGEGSTSFG